MSAMTGTDSLLAALWDQTWVRLLPLGVRSRVLPDDLAAAASVGGRQRLTSSCWRLGPLGTLAECRIVLIQGPTAEILNTMIFPARPERLPVFAAELLVFGGRPRLAFLDLQAPGLEPAAREAVASATAPLAGRYPQVPREPEAPAWAVEWSPGGFFFTRTNDPNHLPFMLDLYLGYLDQWTTLAQSVPTLANEPGPGAARALEAYKQEHVAHSPGTSFLGKVFGQEWANRFLNTFLYQ